jgi:DNA topoisomerase VI subunit A
MRILVAAAAVTANSWERHALRREQLTDDVRTVLRDMEAGQRPVLRDISDRGPTYNSYWTQWKSLAVRDGVLERHWKSDDENKKAAQVVISCSKAKEMLVETNGGTFGGHFGTNKSQVPASLLSAAPKGRRREAVSTV